MNHRNFNSIKVRLELVSNFKTARTITRFQFHKGAIRTDYPIPELDSIGNFNSIKVRLEPSLIVLSALISVISIP